MRILQTLNIIIAHGALLRAVKSQPDSVLAQTSAPAPFHASLPCKSRRNFPRKDDRNLHRQLHVTCLTALRSNTCWELRRLGFWLLRCLGLRLHGPECSRVGQPGAGISCDGLPSHGSIRGCNHRHGGPSPLWMSMIQIQKLCHGLFWSADGASIRYRWVERQIRPISLRQLTFFGRTLTEPRLISSANYVRTELPTRYALERMSPRGIFAS